MAAGDIYTLTYPEQCGGVFWPIGPMYIDWVSVEATIDSGPTTPYIDVNGNAVLVSESALDTGDTLSMSSEISRVKATGIGLGLNPVTAVSGITLQFREAAEPSMTGVIEAIMPLMFLMMMMGMLMPMMKQVTAESTK